MEPQLQAVLLAGHEIRGDTFVLPGIRTFETMHTMKPFSSMLYDSTVFVSARILPGQRHGISTNIQISIETNRDTGGEYPPE